MPIANAQSSAERNRLVWACLVGDADHQEGGQPEGGTLRRDGAEKLVWGEIMPQHEALLQGRRGPV